MDTRSALRWPAVVAVALVVAACGGGEGGDGTDADLPAVSQAAERHPGGAGLFQRNCAACHGPIGRGGPAGPPLTDELYADLDDETVRAAVQNGVPETNWDLGAMPARPTLSDADIDALVPYVLELQSEAAEARDGGS